MKNIIKQQFKKSLHTYNKNAIIQHAMANILVNELLNYKMNFNKIFEIGSGTGFLTKQINDFLVFNNFVANDIVEESGEYVKKINSNIKFIPGDIFEIEIPEFNNLIISSAVFQWFEDLSSVIDLLKTKLYPDGILAFTTFSENNFKELRKSAGLGLQYLSLEQIKSYLQKDFDILEMYDFERILEFDNSMQVLKHLKKTGVNALNSRPWTIKQVKDFCNDKNSPTNLTYHPVIVIAQLKKDYYPIEEF